MVEGGSYSTPIGLVYIYNVIVGNGVLAMPAAFAGGGYIVGIVIICFLGLISFITVLDILESIAVANALCGRRSIHQVMVDNSAGLYPGTLPAPDVQHLQQVQQQVVSTPQDPEGELEGYMTYEILRKYEVCELAMVLLQSRWKRIVIYVGLLTYLIGDVAIYASVAGTTLTHVTCSYRPEGYNCTGILSDYIKCWNDRSLTRKDMFRVYVSVFICITGSAAFFKMPTTKVLQVITYTMRSVALLIMIIWNIAKLSSEGSRGDPPAFDLFEFPMLLGTCLYAYMWHHSVPGVIQPVSLKGNLVRMLSADYILVNCFYLLLPLTSIFTFQTMQRLYNLNFWSDICATPHIMVTIIEYYLAIYPICSISTTIPILMISLTNNMKNMILYRTRTYSFFVDRILFTLISIVLPAIIAITVSDLSTLFSWIGGLGGLVVQYLAPTFLVVAARQWVAVLPPGKLFPRPFRNKWVPRFLYVWVVIAFIFTLLNLILNEVRKSRGGKL